jgi:thymidylate synthase
MKNVNDIRNELFGRYLSGEFVTDKTGVKCVEIINASFIADEECVFGELTEYVHRELAWYKSTSRSVHDIPGVVPQIWLNVADDTGMINSNYGWCIWSAENGHQYYHALNALKADRDTRRSCMIYIRPSMQTEYCEFGMSDFMCTYNTQHLIRGNKLHYIVSMRSNDVYFGYRNDRFWHNYVHDQMLHDLQATYPGLEKGDLYWNASSFHIYERHFPMLNDLIKAKAGR